MSTLYEYYNSGDDGYADVYDIAWKAQTFTPAIAHKITSVKLKLYRVGNPGTVTVSIKATSNGHPTGEDLCSGTTNGNTLTTDLAGEWREITLGNGYDLSAAVKYAIVVRVLLGDWEENHIHWLIDGSDPTYAGGCFEASVDSGSNWISYPAYDLMFEEWGEAVTTTKTVSMDALLRATDTKAISLDMYIQETDAETISIDALIKALGLSKTVALDVILGIMPFLLKEDGGILLKEDGGALLQEYAYTKTVLIDALLKATDTEAINLDVYLKAIDLKSINLDALLKTIESKTIDLDAILKAIDIKTLSLDALIKALGVSKTVALDVILGEAFFATVNLDALLKGIIGASVNLDLLIQALDKQDISLDALIVARNLESISVDALLRGLDTETISLDAYIKAINLVESVNLDMLIADVGITKTVALDAILKSIGEQTVDLDALLKGIATTSVSLDTILGGALFALISSISLDTVLFKALPPNRIYTIEIRNGAGDLLAILENAHGISYAQIINSPHALTFNLPANDSKASNILLANECWLRDNQTDTIIRKFKLQRKMDMRT